MQYFSNKYWLLTSISLSLFFGLATTVNAGGWLRSEGEHRYSAHIQQSTSDRAWDQYRNDRPYSCTSTNTSLSHQYEYGYNYYYTLFGKINMASSACNNDRVSGFGDLSLGVRGRLKLYTNGFAWEAAVIIPTGYDNESSNRLGYGEFGIDLSLHGRTDEIFLKHSFTYSAGVRFWTGEPTNRFYTKVRWRYMQNKSWSYFASLSGSLSLNTGNPLSTNALSNDFENEYDAIRGQLSIKHKLMKRINVSGGIYKNLWGHNTSQYSAVFINFSYVWGRL